MQFFKALLPDNSLLQLDDYALDLEAHHLTINVSSAQAIAQCPLCGGFTQRIHSRYERTLADLPCVEFSLTLILQVCKFFCPNAACHRRIFTERIPTVAMPWARKTTRLMQRLTSVALALGGAAGARLSKHIGLTCCGSTLLNQLEKLPLPQFEIPKILGVDDFAFRKGHHYGTILVNLETHQPIALLPDRKAETLTVWLQDHPGVEVLSRDRSKTYKRAMNEGAPDALQVADRFHLVKNLSETLEKALSGYQSELITLERQLMASDISCPETVLVPTKSTATAAAQQQTQTTHQKRVQQQKTIKDLTKQRWSQQAIAQELGISIRTVQRYLNLRDLPETPTRRPTLNRSLLDPYKPQILSWWNSGITRPMVLMTLLEKQGYTGSQRTLTRYISRLREAQGLPPSRVQITQPLPKVMDPQLPPLTARRLAYLIVQSPENRDLKEAERLERLVKQHDALAAMIDLADDFLQMVRHRQPDALDNWLLKVLTGPFKAFQSFGNGLIEDYAAVKAGLTLEVSNGPVEGLNNRLKMLKRQMYGRASLGLLTKRFIAAA
ncbi:ISL3 family transposase [Adonisia turfae]